MAYLFMAYLPAPYCGSDQVHRRLTRFRGSAHGIETVDLAQLLGLTSTRTIALRLFPDAGMAVVKRVDQVSEEAEPSRRHSVIGDSMQPVESSSAPYAHRESLPSQLRQATPKTRTSKNPNRLLGPGSWTRPSSTAALSGRRTWCQLSSRVASPCWRSPALRSGLRPRWLPRRRCSSIRT